MAEEGELTPTWQINWADISLFATACMWAINILVVKDASQRMDSLAFNALRMILSTAVLGICAWGERNPAKSRLGARFLGFSLLSGVVYPFMFMTAIRNTTAGNTGLLLSSMPAWTALLSAIFLHERLPRISWLGLAFSVAGAGAIAFAGGNVSLSTEYLSGNALMLLSAICWASATVVSGKLLRQTSPIRLAFWSSCLATPIQLAYVAPKLPLAIQQLRDPHLLACLVYSGAFSTGLAYATWHFGVRQLGPSHAAIYQNVVTVVTLLGSWLALGETPRLAQIWGGLLIFFGIVLVRRRTLATRRGE
ncbi:MAG: DMT family transporter [Planctomycetales bacterium]|nr:DMT family transporter [Planctomycetales bacterium]